MILIHLGYEREHLQRSDPATDVAHGCQPNDRARALCGVTLRTSFENLLFAVMDWVDQRDGDREFEPGGTPRCAECRRLLGSL